MLLVNAIITKSVCLKYRPWGWEGGGKGVARGWEPSEV